MEHVRLLCYSDHCLVMDHDKNATKSFLTDLVSDLTCDQKNKTNGHVITHIYQELYSQHGVDFEHVVLENALTNIVTKFRRHLSLIKPALDLLLQQIAQDPATHNLRRLLAFRKSLSEFEQNVSQVMKVVQQLMANDEDMVGLYLTRPGRDLKDHVEVEMLLETNYTDLEEIESDIRNVKDMIEDTNQFISAHLDSVRNKMIRLSLFMEMGALALGSGAVVGGIFGMNLTHGLEEHPTAFYFALGGMGLMMTGIFAGFATNYNKLKVDTSSANSFKTLKNFFTYVDDLEYLVRDGRLTEPEFRAALDKLTGIRVTDEEFEFIFRMFDINKDGLINTSEELNIHKSKKGA